MKRQTRQLWQKSATTHQVRSLSSLNRCWRVAVVALLILSSGCSSLFFLPMKPWVQNPTRIGLGYEDIVLIHPRGERVHGWWLPAVGEPRGTVYFLHGNAQNISTHIMSVNWLPDAGFNVFLLDYRGYGLSEGKAKLDSALEDIQLGLDWLGSSSGSPMSRLQGKPLIVFGQSLGASMAIDVMSSEKNQEKAQCAVFEAAFSGYRDIAGVMMKRSWLLWPMRPLVLPLLPNHEMDPIERIADVLMPKMIMHSKEDAVVPFSQGEALYDAASSAKTFQPLLGEHIAALRDPTVQKRMLEYFYASCGIARPVLRDAGEGQNGVLAVPPAAVPTVNDARTLQF
jgi:uncharacterized protein